MNWFTNLFRWTDPDAVPRDMARDYANNKAHGWNALKAALYRVRLDNWQIQHPMYLSHPELVEPPLPKVPKFFPAGPDSEEMWFQWVKGAFVPEVEAAFADPDIDPSWKKRTE